MQISFSEMGSDVHVALHGPLDAVSVARDRDAADRIVNAASNTIVLSLTGVGFVDASGLGFLTHIAKRAAAKGCKLRIENVSGQPRHFLATLGLCDVFGLNGVSAQEPGAEAALEMAA